MLEQARILVVEDDPGTRRLLTKVLQKAGFDVTTATDGEEGLNALLSQAFDLAILDVVMPKASGFSVAWRLRKAGLLERTPLMFMSVRNNPTERVKGLSIGAEDYIVKPFDPREIKLKAQRVIARNRNRERQLQPRPEDREKIASGNLGSVFVADIVQFLHVSCRSAVLEIEGRPDGWKKILKGALVFVNGELFDAEVEGFADLEAEHAALELCTWKRGTYRCQPFSGDIERRIQIDTRCLLLQAMQELDEEALREKKGLLKEEHHTAPALLDRNPNEEEIDIPWV